MACHGKSLQSSSAFNICFYENTKSNQKRNIKSQILLLFAAFTIIESERERKKARDRERERELAQRIEEEDGLRDFFFLGVLIIWQSLFSYFINESFG